MDVSAVLRRLAKKRPCYYHLHILYFVGLSLLGALLLRSFGTREGSTHSHLSFLDCFYTAVSAMCLSGLSSIQIEDIPAPGQVLVMVLMVLGGQVLSLVVPLLVKKHRYCKIARMALRPRVKSKSLFESLYRTLCLRSNDDLWLESLAFRPNLPESFKVVFLEHQAICHLADIVVWYLLAVHLLGFVVAWISIQCSSNAKSVLESKTINPGFFALFATISAFNNVGFVLTNENLVAFNTNSVLLLDLGLVILLGNTLFPVALRGILWLVHRYTTGTKKEVYTLLLEHPRKYYLHLFPKTATLWLLLAVTGSNALGGLIFCALDWNNEALDGLRPGEKLVNGLFQAFSTRSGGMNSLNLVELSQAMLFFYCVMMYIKPYPVLLRGEQSREDDTTLLTQSRRNLANDNTFLFLLVVFISISLNSQMEKDPRNFNLFAILFEVASAYGCVGLTLGYSCNLRLQPGHCKDTTLSFSGTWNAPGKMFIIAVMFIGRHRDLPHHIDSTTDMEKISRLSRRPSFIALTQPPVVVPESTPPV
ncbi:sodium transporter HKT1 [Selaginella moellendorffii]|uniref:sodium transporter HKT1 n=1 Tax=Selaginella moellendorffii TaxID=88036 RepID=UPI000D1C538C|nr:sodium transporter HKT1 [Selaginella moellendorffii]|eukprot:XP_024520310.1 sodium transporter HKT1 [Selaginella moellendorffii]